MSEHYGHWQLPFTMPLKSLDAYGAKSSCLVPSGPARRLSGQGRAILTRAFNGGCHWPSREQKDALLRDIQKMDPAYTMAKLVTWFCHRRKSLQEPRKGQKGGSEDSLDTLLDPTTALAREMWPSLSADTLHRLHNMLLQQPQITDQHKEMLASHFGVERKHLENFLNWRVAFLRREPQDMDEPSESRPHLPTPASSISPEPLHREMPHIHAQMHHQLPADTSTSPAGGLFPGCPPIPGSVLESHLASSPPFHIPSNMSPHQTNSLMMSHLSSPPRERLSHAKPIQRSPQTSSVLPNTPSGDTGRMTLGTGQEIGSPGLASAAAVKPPGAIASTVPRTLRELEEAYGPTYARIERFLQDVGRGKYTRVGLTPEMLKEVKP